MLRTCEGKNVCFSALDPSNRRPTQTRNPKLLFKCAPISDLPSDINTMVSSLSCFFEVHHHIIISLVFSHIFISLYFKVRTLVSISNGNSDHVERVRLKTGLIISDLRLLSIWTNFLDRSDYWFHPLRPYLDLRYHLI